MMLGNAIEKYIEYKQSEGVVYRNQASRLRSFGRQIGDIELEEIAASQILIFLNRANVSAYTWRTKYAQIARFFRYWQILGAIQTIRMPPPRGIVRPTFSPNVYSRPEIRSILQATNQIPLNGNCTVHPETARTLLLLVYGTGARLSEAISLRAKDVDHEHSTIVLRAHGTGPSRSLPIGPDLRRILNRYSKWKRSMGVKGEFFLVRRDGSQLIKDGVYLIFQKLLLRAGVSRRDHESRRPRIQDFRPTFAVHQITSWIRKGKDLGRLLPALAGYLGLVDLSATERFLALTPERFKRELDKLSPQRGERWSANPETMKFLSRL